MFLNSVKHKIVKSAYFISSKIDESNVTHYTYDYNHTENCIHGKKHDRINGYVCRNGFNVYGGCFSARCKNLKTKKIITIWHFDNLRLSSTLLFHKNIVCEITHTTYYLEYVYNVNKKANSYNNYGAINNIQ
jgi:hypothetical protein